MSIGNTSLMLFVNKHIYTNDIKQTWFVIKDTLQKKKQSSITAQFILNNRIITEPDEIANEFNAYFIDIGQLLSEFTFSFVQSGLFTKA